MPEPLTSRQRLIYWTLAIMVGFTRLFALSRSLWDWDEALFSMALRRYDVALYHPHPPGFPLFVLAAKIARLFLHSDFRALQAVTLAGALLLFPAVVALGRELRFPFVVAAGGAAIYASLPTVWVYGGTAFSDIPATTLVIFASALLLRGCTDRRAYVAGAALLGISVGFRTQNLLIGCAPALYATWCAARARAWRSIVAALACGAAIVAISYGGAAWVSSDPPRGYLAAMSNLRRYVRQVDSFLNHDRATLLDLVPEYFVHPMRSGKFDYVIVAFAAIGLLTSIRRFGTVMLLLMFLPFELFAWLMLDINSISRYGTAFLPLHALLAALGASAIPWFSIDVVLIAAIVGRLVTWTVPPIRVVRDTESPTVAAMQAVLADHSATVFANANLAPFCEYYLNSKRVTIFNDVSRLPVNLGDASAPWVTEGITATSGAKKFWRSRDRLWNIVRHRYFEVSVTRMSELWRFGEGWYDEEGEGPTVIRWMGSRSKTILPPIAPRMRIALEFAIPSELVAGAPALTVELNGKLVGRLRCTSEVMTGSWDVDARTDGGNELVLSIDRVVNPLREHLGSDSRDLGLELRSYSWTPIR